MSFLKSIAKEIGNEYAGLVSDGVSAGDTKDYIDTGSYIFNALVSGSIYGGVPSNKITAIAGESSTGKTFFCLGIVQHFLDSDPDAGVIYFESESAISKQMIVDRGIHADRMMIVPVSTIEEFRTQSCRILDKYMEQNESDRKPMMFVLDSLGMLASNKEVEDVANDKNVRDMTKSQLIKGAFRVLTLKLGKANVPMLVTTHTYDVRGSYIPLKYASSTIVYLSKKKEKDGTEVVGNIIKCKTQKSRLTKENSQVETRLYYDRGLDRYYGLLELGEKHGVFTRKGNRIVVGDSSVYPSAILKDPEKYFTEEVMDKLDEAAQKEFRYGN